MASRDRDRKARGPVQAPGLVTAPTKAIPKKAGSPPGDDTRNETLIIRFDQLDIGGPFCITRATSDELLLIFTSVANLESMKVGEAFSGGYPGKLIPTADLPSKQAKASLLNRGLDDQDVIGELRLGGEPRLWGFLRGRFFHVFWWDPGHLVWPSKKKHT